MFVLMGASQTSRISCEQVYNIWATEPHLLQIYDLRNDSEFREAHIPGAIACTRDQLITELGSLGDRLAVIVASPEVELVLAEKLKSFTNFVFMSQCHRWKDLNKPMAGQAASLIKLDFYKRHHEGEVIVRNDVIFQQLFEPQSSTYTYIIADKKSKEAAIIDPVLETVDRDLKLIEELGLRLMYVLDTHIHADHITGAGELRKRTQARTAVSADAEAVCFDIQLEDGQELLLGDKVIRALATPGHTNSCMTFAFEGVLFTGDSLLVRSCGRTDFQQGSSEKLYDSIHRKLFSLPDDTVFYPGHDYRGYTSSTIGAEKIHNPRAKVANNLSEFQKIMSELKLANPKRIHEAVPANLACGQPQDQRVMHPQVVDGIPEVAVEDVLAHLPDVAAKRLRLIDVRRPDEYVGELGHIEGAELVTLGADLTAFLEKGDREQEIVFVCRSGGRSGNATAESVRMGYKKTINMLGGMLRWNERKLPTVK